MDDHERRREVAERAARAGGAVAMADFRGSVTVERKANRTDVVTRADREAQRCVASVIEEAFPDDVIVGEEDETRTAVPDEGAAWVVDPIDGTANFVGETRMWATSVAAVVDGEPVAACNHMPAMGDTFVSGPDGVRRNGDPVSVSDETRTDGMTVVPTYWWGHDQREAFAAITREILERFADLHRIGSAQCVLSYVASGRYDAAVTDLAMNPWDSVAGVHMVRQAGGLVTDITGERWCHDSRGLVAASPSAHEDALAATQVVEN